MHTRAPGEVLAGKYRIERVLGEGGMGVVYAAHHELLDQRVAIKLLLPEITKNQEAVARFLNEARASCRIQNEHVARVLDVGKLEGGDPYMVIEYLEGQDLSRCLAERGPLPVADAVDWTMQALEAVAQAHALGIVHRDLKPSNLFLARRQDGTSQIKVLDFGISKALDPAGASRDAVTSTNSVLGSPAYMSPEQLRNPKGVDSRTDIWAMGVVLYELLTDGLPFDGDNVVALFASIQENAPRRVREARPDVPALLEAAVLKCLRANQRERFASVAELAAAIATFGTRTSSLCRERIERILPASARVDALAVTHRSSPDLADLEQGARGEAVGPTIPAPPPSAGTGRAGDTRVSGESGAATGREETAAPWATPRTAAVSRARRQVTVLLAALVVVVGGAGVVFWKGQRTPATAAPARAEGTLGPVAIPTPDPTPDPSASPSPSPAPSPSLVPSPSLAPSASPIASPSPNAKAAPATPATVTRAPPSKGAAPPKGQSCDPPYYIDARGHQIFKPECL